MGTKTKPTRSVTHKKKTRRGNKRKYKSVKNNLHFSIIAQNVSGIVSKKDSLCYVLNMLSPSVIVLQETKVNKVGKVKLDGYQIFEKVRTDISVGGLLTAVLNVFNPVYCWLNDSDKRLWSTGI